MVFLQNMVAVTTSAGGRIQISSATACVTALDQVEQILVGTCGASLVPVEMMPSADQTGFSFGVLGKRARERAQQPVFQ